MKKTFSNYDKEEIIKEIIKWMEKEFNAYGNKDVIIELIQQEE